MPALQWLFLRKQIGLPIFCAAGNCKRRLMAASFAPSPRSGMDRKLPCLGTGTAGLRHPYTGILQSWECHRVSASSRGPRLGCDTFFGCQHERESTHDCGMHASARHAPIEHGKLTFDLVSEAWLNAHPDPRLLRLASSISKLIAHGRLLSRSNNSRIADCTDRSLTPLNELLKKL
jgi:hypothetical protein